MDATVYIAHSSVTKWIWYLQRSGLREIQHLLVSVCLRTRQLYASRVMWTSHVDFDSFIFLCVYFDLSKKRWSSPLDVIPFFALQAVQRKHSLLPTHHTGQHPVIWHRDVPPQECCISDIPSALPKDRFPASTFDSYLQSASFGDNIFKKTRHLAVCCSTRK